MVMKTSPICHFPKNYDYGLEVQLDQKHGQDIASQDRLHKDDDYQLQNISVIFLVIIRSNSLRIWARS